MNSTCARCASKPEEKRQLHKMQTRGVRDFRGCDAEQLAERDGHAGFRKGNQITIDLFREQKP